jgi:hypothetical protein
MPIFERLRSEKEFRCHFRCYPSLPPAFNISVSAVSIDSRVRRFLICQLILRFDTVKPVVLTQLASDEESSSVMFVLEDWGEFVVERLPYLV